MFQFSSQAKRLSWILMVVGLVSLVLNFTLVPKHGAGNEDNQEHAVAAEQAHNGDAHTNGHHEAASGHHGSVDHAEHHDHQAANKPWARLLVNNFFFLAIALGALFFLAVQYAAQAGWSVVSLRVVEAISQFLIIPVLIMIVIAALGFIHVHHVWHWLAEGIADPESANYDEIIAGKTAFLNPVFFTIRAVVYLIGWVWAARMFRKLSILADGGDGARLWKLKRRNAAVFIVFFAVTSSTMAWDWIMSIDTHWFSTLFGWYTFAGMFVTAVTVITLLVIYLKMNGYLPELNQNHIHDLGKFMFAFSIFWTYLWFSQYMLIWYSNIPEEVTYYMIRFKEFKGPFLTALALNFLFPVLVMMSRDSKRNMYFVLVAGIGILIGHWLDHFVMIMPGSVGINWSIGLIDLGIFAFYAGLFIQVVFRSLSKAPLVPKHHPMLHESKIFQL